MTAEEHCGEPCVSCGEPPLEEEEICSYCDKPVDEDNERVWFSGKNQMDHYDCVPASEKGD